MCLFGVSSGSLPVLVRTRMMASKPMLFCTSFLRSLRKCSPSTSTCSVKQRARHRDTLHAHQSFDQQMAALTHSDRSGGLHLEVVVLVDGAASVRGHVSHGGQVYILAGEEEEVHAAALCHTLFGQLLVHSFLRLEQGLEQHNRNFG